MGPQQVLPLRVRVDLEKKVTKTQLFYAKSILYIYIKYHWKYVYLGSISWLIHI